MYINIVYNINVINIYIYIIYIQAYSRMLMCLIHSGIFASKE